MRPIRPLVALSCAAFLFAGSVLAQDDETDEVEEMEGKVEEVVEDRAAEEDSDGEPSDADVGEASYNTEDCSPASGGEDGEAEGEEDDDDDEAGEQDMDECEPVVK